MAAQTDSLTLEEESRLEIKSQEECGGNKNSGVGSSESDSSDSSISSGDYDDDKRLAAETIRNCFLQVARKSAEVANSGVTIKEWWKKGAIAEHSRKIASQEGAAVSELPAKADSSAAEKLNWIAEGIISAKGISTMIDTMQQEADKKLTKKIQGQREQGRVLVPPEKVSKKKKSEAVWMDTPSAQITDEVKRDLAILKMRDTLDPKRFYKSLDHKKEPSWVQIGTVVDNPYDGKSGRLPKRLRKRTIAEQWLADPELTEMRQKRMGNIATARKEEKSIRLKNYPHLKNAKRVKS